MGHLWWSSQGSEVALFPGLPTVQFVIACSIPKQTKIWNSWYKIQGWGWGEIFKKFDCYVFSSSYSHMLIKQKTCISNGWPSITREWKQWSPSFPLSVKLTVLELLCLALFYTWFRSVLPFNPNHTSNHLFCTNSSTLHNHSDHMQLKINIRLFSSVLQCTCTCTALHHFFLVGKFEG